MKKKLTLVLSLASVACLCLGLGACRKKTDVEKYQDQGYTISVTYDANGGSFFRPGVNLMDMFNPSDYEADEEGNVNIYLLEPTDPDRPTGSSDRMVLTLDNHFLAGWYQKRELQTDADGNVLSEDGKIIKEVDGVYYYADSLEEGKTKQDARPAYKYSERWDFEKPLVYDADSNEEVTMTLYAGWVPYYQFDYYYQEKGVWTKYSTSSFDYKTTNENEKKADKDTIWLPDWKEGAMNYSYSYQDGSSYEFPKISDTTFAKAYLDEACTQEIDGQLEHQGTLDVATAQAVNRIQNVYVVVEQGERYKIETTKQFVDNANVKGIYEFYTDKLEFTDELQWPAKFTINEFSGQFIPKKDTITFSNVSVLFSSTNGTLGGLFGKISKDAVMQNVVFDGVTMDYVKVTCRSADGTFGLFAGEIEEGAKLSVTLQNAIFHLKEVRVYDAALHVLANGDLTGLTADMKAIKLIGHGDNMGVLDNYMYTFDPLTSKVDENGKIILTHEKTSYYADNAEYEIQ